MNVFVRTVRTVDGIAIVREETVPLEEVNDLLTYEELLPGVLWDLDVEPADCYGSVTNTHLPLDKVRKCVQDTF